MSTSGTSGEVKRRVSPRKTPTRDEKYLGLALFVAEFSKDPSTQHGAHIVSKDNYPLGYGYNGPPKEIDDLNMNWDRPEKYSVINHAEYNAIMHSDRDRMEGATIYATGKPCPACMLKIITYGIKRVVYLDDSKMHDAGSMCVNASSSQETENLAKMGGVQLVPFVGDLNWIRDRVLWLGSMGVFSNSE